MPQSDREIVYEVARLMLHHFSGIMEPSSRDWLATLLMGGTNTEPFTRSAYYKTFNRFPELVGTYLYSIPRDPDTIIWVSGLRELHWRLKYKIWKP